MALKEIMNDYIIKNELLDNPIFNNSSLFSKLSYIFYDVFYDTFNGKIFEFEYDKMTRVPFDLKIDLIKQFYKSINVHLDLETLLTNGTIDFEYYDESSENDITDYITKGYSFYENDAKLIDVVNTGFLVDSVTLVHELSHYRNQIDHGRTKTGDVLTEVLATCEELMYLDFLFKMGYEEDVNQIIENSCLHFYLLNKDNYSIFNMFFLFDQLGDIDLENYQTYFKNVNNYEVDLQKLEYFAKKGDFKLKTRGYYILSSILGIYLYCKYKKDNQFYHKINLLHEKINQQSMIDCLKIMGLSDLGNEDMVKIKMTLENFNHEVFTNNKKKSK